MRRGLRWAFVLCVVLDAHAIQAPFTAKDIGLMLRSGYSSSSVQQELAARHFADTLDQVKETMLTQAGATPALIGALKSGTYSVPPEQANAAKEKIAAETKRRTAQAEESRK